MSSVGVKPNCLPGSTDPNCSGDVSKNNGNNINYDKDVSETHSGDSRYHSFHSCK